jgi:hypothetical protein
MNFEAQHVDEINQLKNAMKQMKSDSIEQQHSCKEHYERSIQGHLAALEELKSQLLKSNRREKRLADKLQIQCQHLVEIEEKLQDTLEDNTLLKVSLQQKLPQSNLLLGV